MDLGRIYPNFCMTARALEEVGERWSLLVVGDLSLGPADSPICREAWAGSGRRGLTDRLRYVVGR
jgi:DNA-binding HxlR family transcriptional regulator